METKTQNKPGLLKTWRWLLEKTHNLRKNQNLIHEELIKHTTNDNIDGKILTYSAGQYQENIL